MSRQPSPGPPSLHNTNQMYHQQALPSSSAKQRTKPFTANLPGGADDVKYQAKYKELKKKVKEIELDNDRLYLKLLLAKKNIRRMNLERAILYERLAAVPPTPGRNTQELPPEHDPMYAQQPSGPPDSSHSVDPLDQAPQEYLRSNLNLRMVQGRDGRVAEIEDPTATNGAREHAGGNGPPPPHGLPLVHGYHDPNRQLPPPSVPSIREPHDEVTMSNNHGFHAAPRTTPHSNNNTAHHSRGAPARTDRDASQGEPSRTDTLPPRHGAHHRQSSSDSGEGYGDFRSQRADIHDPGQQQIPSSHGSNPEIASPPSVHSPPHGRIHNHQRMGPGVHLHRQAERDPELTRQLMREREAEREREREREVALRERLAAEEEEELRQVAIQWPQHNHRQRERGGGDAARDRSHSDSPSSRPPSGQSHSHSHSHERSSGRAYPTTRVANLLVQGDHYDSHDTANPHPRGYTNESSSSVAADTRKRSRRDVEAEGHGGATAGSAEAYPPSHRDKRVHAEDSVAMSRASSIRDGRVDEDDYD